MPDPLPERKVRSPEHEREYERFAEKSFHEKNSSSLDTVKWSDPSTHSAALKQKFQESLSKANTYLNNFYVTDKGLNAQTGRVAEQYARSWTGDIYDYRGDLAGFWNNFKLGLETSPITSLRGKSAGSQKEPTNEPFERLLDCLALAGQRGEINQWLAEWNTAMLAKSPNLEQIAGIAEAIGQNISFTREFVGDYYASIESDRLQGLLDDSSVQRLRALGDEVLAALSAIAFEVRRQAGKVLEGVRDPAVFGTRADALQTTLATLCDRTRAELSIRQRVAALDLLGSLIPKIDAQPGVTVGYYKQTLTTRIEALEHNVKSAARLTAEISKGKDPGAASQQQTAKDIKKASEAVVRELDILADVYLKMTPRVEFDGLEDVTVDFGTASNRYLKDSVRADVYIWADALMTMQGSLASKLTDPVAKGIIKGEVKGNLMNLLNKIELSRQGNFYAQAEKAAADGTLGQFWTKQKKLIVAQMDLLVKHYPGTAAADRAKIVGKELEKLFDRGLTPTLEKWKKANSPADIYELAWQLIATLSAYKAGVESLLSKGSDLGAGASQVLDAMIAAIEKQVQSSAGIL